MRRALALLWLVARRPPAATGALLTPADQLWPEREVSGKLKLAASGSYSSVFRADDEDVRPAFKNPYDIWPFFYQNLYEYEPKKSDIYAEKANDKRFTIPNPGRVIPVHENGVEKDENTQTKNNSKQSHKHTNGGTTDNPIFGNQPFFSYVLNDYFDKTDDDDPPSFKGLSWGKEFDHEMALQDIDDYAKRIRRLEENPSVMPREETEKKSSTFTEHDAPRGSSNSRGRDARRESELSEKGNDRKHDYDERYQYDGQNYRGFKDFADSFAHRFGSEDHDRATTYGKKNNADKGEKKTGFHTIYHKDEYQEHRDFFDNTGNSENVEEKGASKVHIGGSEALLHSSAGAAAGSDDNKLSHAENIEKEQFERNHKEKQHHDENELGLDRYRDVAKRTALSNNADYVDRYIL